MTPIRHVVIYTGHEQNPLLGPYSQSVTKRIEMFQALNQYREECQRAPWNVLAVPGEELVDALKALPFKETLLVIPAGQSTLLDAVFSVAQKAFIKDEFFANGGRGYFTCGSSYLVSRVRKYTDLCSEQPDNKEPIVKISSLPLFEGTAEGPLCPYPGKKYHVGFYSDAVDVTDGKDSCTIFLSGGGSFFLGNTEQKVKVLIRYPAAELIRCKKQPEECKAWENAAILVSVGQGAALLSMFHPYYGPNDINVEAYERLFSGCGTNWKEVKERLSPFDHRMRFALHSMLIPLEDNVQFHENIL
jgi:glutamine amidotransferase-like uncharacterized protein